jgi:hypothetical protein
VIAGLLAEAQTDPVFAAEYRQRVLEPRSDEARVLFGRAVERGEIPANTKVDVVLDLIFGAVYHRLLHGHALLNDRFVRDVVDTALGGVQPGPAND